MLGTNVKNKLIIVIIFIIFSSNSLLILTVVFAPCFPRLKDKDALYITQGEREMPSIRSLYVKNGIAVTYSYSQLLFT